MRNAYGVVQEFERRVAEYAGAPYAVAVDTCTAALLLCCAFLKVKVVSLPRRTYISVPFSVMHAGGKVVWDDRIWEGTYRLDPYPIVDSALRFTYGMYQPRTLYCLSFHAKKILKIGRGGMILTDDADAAAWLRKARYDGREECPLSEDDVDQIGWSAVMEPERAARGLQLLDLQPQHNEDLAVNYPDISKFKVFADRTPDQTTPRFRQTEAVQC